MHPSGAGPRFGEAVHVHCRPTADHHHQSVDATLRLAAEVAALAGAGPGAGPHATADRCLRRRRDFPATHGLPAARHPDGLGGTAAVSLEAPAGTREGQERAVTAAAIAVRAHMTGDAGLPALIRARGETHGRGATATTQ
jgi:hypothetical protein